MSTIDWVKVTIVFGVDEDGDMDQTYGYAYDAGGEATPVAPSPREFKAPIGAYRAWLRGEKEGFRRLLFQFNRKTSRYNMEFDCDPDSPRWHSLAVVFSLADAGRGFGNGGYAYGENGDGWAVSFPVLDVRPAVLDYVRAIRDPVPDALSRVLLQYAKRLGKARLTVEFEHPERWMITPETARDVLASIRPNFEATSPPPVSHAGRLQA